MPAIYAFGPFRLDTDSLASCSAARSRPNSASVPSRCCAAVERPATPVGKEALIAAAWPGLAVEDSNLTVQIAALRKVLDGGGGAGWIETLAAPRLSVRRAGRPHHARDRPTHRPRPHSGLALPDKPSVAVLPFANLGRTLSRTISPTAWSTTSLQACRASNGCSSSHAARASPTGAATDRCEAGRPMSSACATCSRAACAGPVDRVRISCQLVDAATGTQVWVERYDRKSR